MDINDFFGNDHPLRPDTPDFWRLVEQVLALDSGTSGPDSDAYYESHVGSIVDIPSLTYMAMQRAMRALNVTTVGQARDNMGTLTRMTALWMEGFVMGAGFKHGQQVKT